MGNDMTVKELCDMLVEERESVIQTMFGCRDLEDKYLEVGDNESADKYRKAADMCEQRLHKIAQTLSVIYRVEFEWRMKKPPVE